MEGRAQKGLTLNNNLQNTLFVGVKKKTVRKRKRPATRKTKHNVPKVVQAATKIVRSAKKKRGRLAKGKSKSKKR